MQSSHRSSLPAALLLFALPGPDGVAASALAGPDEADVSALARSDEAAAFALPRPGPASAPARLFLFAEQPVSRQRGCCESDTDDHYFGRVVDASSAREGEKPGSEDRQPVSGAEHRSSPFGRDLACEIIEVIPRNDAAREVHQKAECQGAGRIRAERCGNETQQMSRERDRKDPVRQRLPVPDQQRENTDAGRLQQIADPHRQKFGGDRKRLLQDMVFP